MKYDMGPFDYHVFEHMDGRYRTTASSPGVTAAERAAVEQFFFGQTNSASYLDSLAAQPGLIWRRPAERFLFTRVLRGEKDANGRDTLRFETLLLDLDQAKVIGGTLAPCLISSWEHVGDRIVVPSLANRPSVALHRDLISEVLTGIEAGRRIVRSAEDVSLNDVEKLVRLCVDRDDFSLCYRSLNGQAPVQINFTSSSAVGRTPRTSVTEQPVSSLPNKRPQVAVRAATSGLLLIALALFLNTALLAYLILRSSGSSLPNASLENNLKNQIVRERESTSGELKDLEGRLQTDRNQDIGTIKKSIEDASRKDRSEVIQRVGSDLRDRQVALEKKIDKGSDETSKSLKVLSDSMSGLRGSVDKFIARPPPDITPTSVLKSAQDSARRAAGRLVGVRSELDKILVIGKKSEREASVGAIKKSLDELQEDLKIINPEIASSK